MVSWWNVEVREREFLASFQGVCPLLQQLRHCHGFVPEIQGFQMGFDVNAREEVFGVVYVCLAERAKG